MSATLAAVEAALASAIRTRAEWDEPPDLHFIYGDGDSARLSADAAVFPAEAWPEAPTMALPRAAQALEGLPPGFLALVAPGNFLGVAFRCEAWTVKSEPATLRHDQHMQQARLLHQHPRRVEQRNIWAALRDGTLVGAFQDRGSDEIDVHAVEDAEGLIPESLRRMVAVICGGVN